MLSPRTLRGSALLSLLVSIPALSIACSKGSKSAPPAPVADGGVAAPDAAVKPARLAPEDGGVRTTSIAPLATPDAGTDAPSLRVTLEIPPLAPETAPAPAVFDVHPVRQQPLHVLPNRFDREGRLLAACTDKGCDVWERATGIYRGQFTNADLREFRSSTGTMTETSPNGKYALKAWGEKGGVALVRVEGGAILARAERADARCATVGAWKGDEPRAAIPCGNHVLALEGAPAKSTWSAALVPGANAETEGVWSNAIYVGTTGDGSVGDTPGPYREPGVFVWDGTDGGGAREADGGTEQRTHEFDPVGGCVYEESNVCGCDCHESIAIYGCDGERGRDAFSIVASARWEAEAHGTLFTSADGRTFGSLVERGGDHGQTDYSFHAMRVGERTVDKLEIDSIGFWYHAPQVAVLGARGAFVFAKDDGRSDSSVNVDIVRFGKPAATAMVEQSAFGRDGFKQMFVSADERRILLAGAGGAVALDTSDAHVVMTWAPPKRSKDASAATGEIDVNGFLRDPAKANRIGLTFDGESFELDVATKALVARGPIDASELVQPATKPDAPKYTPIGVRELERTADGARMTANDDRVYPQGPAARDAWQLLDESAKFLVGDDRLRSPIVSREQIDPQLVVKGAFAKFLKGEPLPPSRVAQLPFPPVLRVVRGEGDPKPVTVRVDEHGTPASYFEVDHAGRIEKIPAAAAASTVVQTIAAGEATRVRACGAICSPWVSP